MDAIEALVLGIVQGVTEFLPVSSSGHLVLFETLFGIEGEGGILFEVAVHVATLFAIVAVYRTRIRALSLGLLRAEPAATRYAGKIALATLPAVAVGLGAREQVEAAFARPAVAGACLLLTSLILWTTRRTLPRATLAEPGWAAALWIGCGQALAILPGISRSGTTVAVALALGVAPLAAAEFSFLLGVVAIAGAGVLMLPDLDAAAGSERVPILIASAAALISGIAAIRVFLRMLERRRFHVFAYYTAGAGSLFLGWLWLR